MKIEQLHNKKILIAGYGIEGKSTEAFLKKFAPSSTVVITDAKDGEGYLDNQKDFDLLIKTPGIPKKLITIPYTTATNIFFANLDKKHKTVGVTGSKGKSTTASLIYHILKYAGQKTDLVGNIGRPMLEVLMNPSDDEKVYVCELSSYQLDDIEYSPTISLIVSLFPDHIPYHDKVENYYEAKHRIIAKATENDYFVYNPKYQLLVEWAHRSHATTMKYESDFVPKNIPLLGEHNIDNVRAAITVSKILGVSYRESETAIMSFKALPHRLQNIGTYNGITFYDDAISTTPESTIAAIKSIPHIKTIFLGGEDRGYDFTELAGEIRQTCIENIVLFPTSGPRIKKALLEADLDYFKILETTSMKEAVEFAFTNTSQKSVCLLSTASPSYSLWENFIEKGNQFQQFVKKYAEKK